MTEEPKPQAPAHRHRDTLHVDVAGNAQSNSPWRWMLVVAPMIAIALGGAYLASLLTASSHQAPEVPREMKPRPGPARDAERPAPPGKPARAPGESSGVEAGARRFEVDAVLRLIATADPNAGAATFKMCVVCHSAERNAPHKLGPNLWGIVGARKAAFPDFRYSQALREKRGTWSYRDLAEYLHDSRGAVPGTSMAFFGIKDNQRLADLLAYMRTLDDRPVPLPKK